MPNLKEKIETEIEIFGASFVEGAKLDIEARKDLAARIEKLCNKELLKEIKEITK